MYKYIDANKLFAYLKKTMESYQSQMVDPTKYPINHIDLMAFLAREYQAIIANVESLQQEEPNNMIQWTGQNLREVVTFTGKSPKFDEYFKSWEEFEQYVHAHGDIFKLFCEDGSHYEVPVGAWIVKTPDGYNVPSVARFVHAKQELPILPGIEEPGIPGKDFIPVEWVDACEMYGKWKIVKQEQPEVDLEKEMKEYFGENWKDGTPIEVQDDMIKFARHFYELGLNARKEE